MPSSRVRGTFRAHMPSTVMQGPLAHRHACDICNSGLQVHARALDPRAQARGLVDLSNKVNRMRSSVVSQVAAQQSSTDHKLQQLMKMVAGLQATVRTVQHDVSQGVCQKRGQPGTTQAVPWVNVHMSQSAEDEAVMQEICNFGKLGTSMRVRSGGPPLQYRVKSFSEQRTSSSIKCTSMQAEDGVAAILEGWRGFPPIGLRSKTQQYGKGSQFLHQGLESLREDLRRAGVSQESIAHIQTSVLADAELDAATVRSPSCQTRVLALKGTCM